MIKPAAWFNTVENINWNRMWWVVGVLTTIWLGLASIVPAKIFSPISVILSAVQSGFLFAARGTRYVQDRNQAPPADGKP